ncbi:MAG: 50S ribosomal protein L17 [Flavobacteriales bacterium]|nr:MAG: 50S ribosomal protein L17 [Flavobacteriales bacterium]
MRHGKKFNHLSRQAPHRKAMLANMACSLIEHKRVNTTVAKAKALKKFVEPLITKSKTDSTHSRRTVFRYLRSKEAVTELFRDISVKIGDRPGGYTRILRTGFRPGDNAEMCFIELVDYNENMLKDAKKKKSSRKRRGGAKSKQSEDSVLDTETTATTPVDESTETEVKHGETVEATEADTKAEVVEETPAAEVVEEVKTDESVEAETKVEEVKVEEATTEKTEPEAKIEDAPEDKSDSPVGEGDSAPDAETDNSDEEDKKEE